MIRRIDTTLLATIVLLLVLGFFVLASASMVLAERKYGEPYFFLKRQLLYGVLGVVCMFALAFFSKYRFFEKMAFVLLGLNLILLVLVFVPGIGLKLNGAYRWIHIGPAQFQPSELLKLTGVLAIGAWAQRRGIETGGFKRSVMPFLVLIGIVGLLLAFEPDVGTLGVVVASFLAAYFVTGVRFRYLALIGVVLAVAFSLVVVTSSYRLERVKVLFDQSSDPSDEAYQVNQSVLAIGSGGLFGAGFGQSQQKGSFLPEPHGDSIFAVLAEEFGFVGSAFLITAFVVFAWRGFKAAAEAPDTFGRVAATGITTYITAQAFLNAGALSGVFPLTGIPLPFISSGGSSLMVTLIASGILLNISSYGRT